MSGEFLLLGNESINLFVGGELGGFVGEFGNLVG